MDLSDVLNALWKSQPGGNATTYSVPSTSSGQDPMNNVDALIAKAKANASQSVSGAAAPANMIVTGETNPVPNILAALGLGIPRQNAYPNPQGNPTAINQPLTPSAQSAPVANGQTAPSQPVTLPATQGDYPVQNNPLMGAVPPGLIPQSLPKYDGSKIGSMALPLNAINALANLLGVSKDPGYNSRVVGMANQMMTQTQREDAQDDYKRQEQDYEMRHQVANDYLNTAYRNAALGIKTNAAQEKTNVAAVSAIKTVEQQMAEAYDPKDPAGTEQRQRAILNQNLPHLNYLSGGQFDPNQYLNADGSWNPVVNNQKQQAIDSTKERNDAYVNSVESRRLDAGIKTIGDDHFWQLPDETKSAYMRGLEMTLGLPPMSLGNPPDKATFDQTLRKQGVDEKWAALKERQQQNEAVNAQNNTKIGLTAANYQSLIDYRNWREAHPSGSGAVDKSGPDGLTLQQVITDRNAASTQIRQLRAQAMQTSKDLLSSDADRAARAQQINTELLAQQQAHDQLDQIYKQRFAGKGGNTSGNTTPGNVLGAPAPPSQGALPPAPVNPINIGPDGKVTFGATMNPVQNSSQGSALPANIAPWRQKIITAANETGAPPKLISTVMNMESGGQHYKDGHILTSPAGAVGVMQLLPSTAKGLGFDAQDPDQNLLAGATYLGKLYKQYGGDVVRTLAAYHAGPGNVEKFLSNPSAMPQTLKYVQQGTQQLGVPWSAGKQKQANTNDVMGQMATLIDRISKRYGGK